MTDLLESGEFDRELRGTMQRLAERGVATMPAPTARTASVPHLPLAEGVDADIELSAANDGHRVRERLLVTSAVLAIVALLGSLALSRVGGSNATAATASSAQWTQISPSPLAARAGSASVWTGERWFIWGGRAGPNVLADGALYDPATDQWELIATSPLDAATLADGILVGGDVIVAGGWAGTQDSVNAEVALYDPELDAWRELPDAPGPVVHLQEVDGSPTATVLTNDEVALTTLDLTSETWSEPTTTDLSVGLQPSFEGRGSYAVVDDNRYVANFNRLHKNEFLETVYEAPDIMRFHPVVATDREVIIIGHGGIDYDNADVRTVVRHDTRTGESRTFESTGYDPGLGTIILTDDAVALLPDWSSDGGIELFNLATNQWVDVDPPPVAGRRFRPIAISTGRQLLFWGGETLHDGELRPEASGAILSIESSFPDNLLEEWREIAAAPISPRDGHSAVWTGQEMIVWGGDEIPHQCTREQSAADDSCGESDSSADFGDNRVPPGQKGDGAAYDPTTDTWRAIADAPIQPRTQHEAVWTGEEMIVWGGSNGYRPDQMGAAYNPTTDAWRVLPEIAVRQAIWHAVYWDGDFVYVITIPEEAPDRNNLAAFRYDPAIDSWDELGLLGLHRVHHVTEVNGALLVSGYSLPPTGLTEIPEILSSRDHATTWQRVGLPLLEENTTRGPMIIAAWNGEILIFAEEVSRGRSTERIFSLNPAEAEVTFYGDDSGATIPDRYSPAEDVSPFVGPVVFAPDDVVAFGLRGEISRGNPIEGWMSVGDLPYRLGHFGASTTWAEGTVIIWGGRGGWNGAGSVNDGLALDLRAHPID